MKAVLSKFGKNSVIAFAIVGVVSIVLTVFRIFTASKYSVELESDEDHGQDE